MLVIVWGTLHLILTMICGCANNTRHEVQEMNTNLTYTEPSIGPPSLNPSNRYTYVHVNAIQIKGHYQGHPMSIAFPCEVELGILHGVLPNNSSATKVRLCFTQGDSVAQLLEQSKELSLIFNEKGEFVGVNQ